MPKPIGRPNIWDQHADEMARLYEDEKKSRGDIARQYGTSVQTVTRVLSRHGVVFEGRQVNANAGRTPEQQAAINAKISAAKTGRTYEKKPRESRTCEQCGTEYVYRPGRSGERFCSRSCRNTFNAKTNQQTAQDVYADDPKRCPCGDAIPFEYRHTRMFCSPEHRSEYGAKRQPDPENSLIFDCRNCGKSVTRLKRQSMHKYCSNACAQKHTKTKKHIVVDDAVVLDSGYEALFWGLCAFLKVQVERFDRTDCIPFGEDGYYGPDFEVHLYGMTYRVEVKGFEDEDDRARYTAWREQRGPLVVLDRQGLSRLRMAYMEEWPDLFEEYS